MQRINVEPVDQRLRKAILQVVDQQLRNREPAVTRETFDRLCREGFSEGEARKLIGYVVAAEFFEVVRKERRYNEQAFAAKLQALPRLPWAGSEDTGGQGRTGRQPVPE